MRLKGNWGITDCPYRAGNQTKKQWSLPNYTTPTIRFHIIVLEGEKELETDLKTSNQNLIPSTNFPDLYRHPSIPTHLLPSQKTDVNNFPDLDLRRPKCDSSNELHPYFERLLRDKKTPKRSKTSWVNSTHLKNMHQIRSCPQVGI